MKRSKVILETAGDQLDEARVRLAGIYAGTHWAADATDNPFSYRYAAVGDASMTLRTSRFQGHLVGEVPPGDEYVVQWVRSGRAVVDAGRDEILLAPGRPVLFPEYRPFRFDYTDFDQRLVHLDRGVVDRVARERGLVAPDGLRFDHRMNPDAAAVRRWHETVATTTRAMATGTLTPLAWDELTRNTAGAFLDLYPPQGTVLPTLLLQPRNGHIRAAVEFVHENAHLPIGPIEMARAANLSVRGLQVAFQRLLDTRPLTYLRQVRLDRARDELDASDPGTATVAGIALHWGFGNVGRFSAAYRDRFGENPSATLHGRRSWARPPGPQPEPGPQPASVRGSGAPTQGLAQIGENDRELAGELVRHR